MGINSKFWHYGWVRYGVAIAATLASALLRWMMPHALSGAPYLAFYPAVVVAAILGGLGPGLVATVASLLIVNFVFGNAGYIGFNLVTRYFIWTVGGTAISLLAGRMHIARQRAEAEAEAARKLAAIVEFSDEAIIGKRLDGTITSWNRGAQALYGYTEKEVVGRHISMLLPDWQDNEMPELLERLAKGETIQHYESWRRRKDGSEVPVLLKISPIQDGNGTVVGASSIAIDITEKKQVEEALRESEAQFRTLANAIPQLCWMANGDGWIFWYNDRWYEYTGTTPEQMEGWGWQSVHDPDALPSVLERWKGSIASGQPFDMVFPLRGADGVFRPFLTRVMPIKDSTGRVVRWFGTNTDVTEQQKIENAIRAERQLLETVVNHLPAAVLLSEGTELRMRLVNPAYQALAPGKEMQGRTLEEVWAEIGPEVPALFRRVLTTGEPHHAIDQPFLIRRSLEGPLEAAYFSWSVFRVQLPNGQRALLNVAWETTQRKQIEEALRASEERLTRAQEIAHLGSWELDLVANRLTWSDEVYRIFGMQPQEFAATYEAFLEHVHPDDRRRVDEAFGESLREKRDVYEIEHRVVRKDTGDVRVVHEKCEHFRDGAGKIIRSVGMVHDITERKRAEEALRESEERWATTLQSIGDAVISTDATGKVVFMNEVAQRLTGWPLADARGKELPAIFNIVQEVTRIRPENPVAKVLRSGEVVGLANHTALIRRDGAEIPIDDSGAPIRNKDGEIEGVVLVFHDVSEQRRIEKVLRETDRLATTGRLAASIAHEIHNPLDVIGNLLHLITHSTQEDEMREEARMASDELERLAQMTQQMLTFQRESSKPVPVQIKDVIENVLALYHRKLDSAQIEVRSEIDSPEPLAAHPGELRQVFANLIGNAIEAVGRSQGKIRIRAYSAHHWRNGHCGLRVVVADNGKGIPGEVREKVFEPFFTTKGESGTGLGLWVTTGIISKYNGALRVRSTTRAGRNGTCFSVFFPIASSKAAAADD